MSEFLITPGQVERFTAQFKDGAGVAINLIGSTVTLESDGAAISSTVTITNALSGEVDVVISAATTATITQPQRVRFKRVISGGDIYLEAWFWLKPE